MKFSKIFSAGAFSACMVLGMSGISTPALAQYTVESEAARHPELVRALHDLEAALRQVQSTADDFGGRKQQAIHDMVAAIHSLKSALYYRLALDDARLERIP
jgi:hypothetical protein